MDKAMTHNILTAVATAGILGALGFFMGVFEKGSAATSEDEIIAVIEKVMIMDSGKTYKGRMTELNLEMARAEIRLENIRDDVDDLEDILGDLVSD